MIMEPSIGVVEKQPNIEGSIYGHFFTTQRGEIITMAKIAKAKAKKRPARKVSLAKGGAPKSKSRVNEAGNYTKPGMRKQQFNRIKAGGKGGAPGQWSARKAQMLASAYKKAGGGYRN